MNVKPYYSVAIPVFNEQGNITKLFNELHAALKKLKKSFEIIIVDDGSTDNTYEELLTLHPLTIVRMRQNSGQSSALDAGIRQAQGEIIITMDGDGQDNPKHIKDLLTKLSQGYDVVCAWRFKRKDSFSKRFISNGARVLRKFFVDDGVHDSGTQFRVYKRICFEDFEVYGELHRMIPALMKWRGFKVTEVKVTHRVRVHGVSKYTWKRIFKGFLDMIYIWFWRKYSTRPLHLFGGIGLVCIMIGAGILIFLAYLRLFQEYYLSNKIWPLVGFFLVFIGIQFLLSGLLSANLVETSGKRKYYIRDVKKI